MLTMLSYYDSYNPRHNTRDIERIKDLGFDTVVFPVSEEQARFNGGNIEKTVARARSIGLEAWVSPWGVGGVFGGEGIGTTSSYAARTAAVREWTKRAIEFGTDGVMLDEPKAEVELVNVLLVDVFVPFNLANRKVHLCLEANKPWQGIDPLIVAACQGIGTDPYWIGHHEEDRREYIDQHTDALLGLVEPHHETHLWAQGFSWPRRLGLDWVYENTLYHLRKPVDRVGIWGYLGGGGMGCLSSEDAAGVWSAIVTAMKEHKRGEQHPQESSP